MPFSLFTSFPVLITHKLTLRQLGDSDTEEILALHSDPEVNKYLDRQPSETMEDARNFISRIAENIERKDSLYWVINLTNNKTFAGTICLFNFSDNEPKCEIGFELLPRFQGQGIMQEAAQKVIEYATQKLHIEIVEAYTHKDNRGSARLLKQLDFQQSQSPDETNPDYFIHTLTKNK